MSNPTDDVQAMAGAIRDDVKALTDEFKTLLTNAASTVSTQAPSVDLSPIHDAIAQLDALAAQYAPASTDTSTGAPHEQATGVVTDPSVLAGGADAESTGAATGTADTASGTATPSATVPTGDTSPGGTTSGTSATTGDASV